MPQVLLALAAAAGFVAAARKIAALIDQHASGPHGRTAEETRVRTAASDRARDLGALEWDETSGVYRPRPAPRA